MLHDKYKISEETYKQMVRDGLISPTHQFHYEIFEFYSKRLTETKRMDALQDTCEKFRVSHTVVYDCYNKFKKMV